MYNGKGNFDKSLDLAKTLDDPQLIMYGLVKQIESLKIIRIYQEKSVIKS